jgi:hypothetical protein
MRASSQTEQPSGEDDHDYYAGDYADVAEVARVPAFDKLVREGTELGVTVRLVAGWPRYVASTRRCPECGQNVEVRAPIKNWDPQRQLEHLAEVHPQDVCARVRLERTAHVQWGLDYGYNEVQAVESEQEAFQAARKAADDEGGEGPAVVHRIVGPWRRG